MNHDNSSSRLAPKGLLWLIGYRGSGKTTVGRGIADRLGVAFFDADHELELSAQRSIPEIFQQDGEAVFRDLEQTTIAKLAEQPPPAIIATGGGAILRQANRDALRRSGLVVWLKADVQELRQRLETSGGGNRPSLTSAGLLDEISNVLTQRTPLYEQTADVIVDASFTPEVVGNIVTDCWMDFVPNSI